MWAMRGVVAAGSVLEDSPEQASILQSTRSIDLQKSIGQDVATATTNSSTLMGVASVSSLDLVELTKEEEKQFLDEHNYYRCMHGAPALTWDDGMAKSALKWSESCCEKDLVHSKSYQESPRQGENLAAGQGTIREAVEGWYKEVSDCNFPGCEPVKPDGPMVGHFTAMVWKSTTLLGCVRNAEGFRQGRPLYVCRYAEAPPNFKNKYRANVFGASVSSEDCGRVLAPCVDHGEDVNNADYGQHWKDEDYGDTCENYATNKWCKWNGEQGESWKKHWGRLEDYPDEHEVTAKQACCACGGGSAPVVPPTVNTREEFDALPCVVPRSLNSSMSSSHGPSCLPCLEDSQCAGSNLTKDKSFCCPYMRTCVWKSNQKCSLIAACTQPGVCKPRGYDPDGQETTITWEAWGKPTCPPEM